jgi:hypothetical protein
MKTRPAMLSTIVNRIPIRTIQSTNDTMCAIVSVIWKFSDSTAWRRTNGDFSPCVSMTTSGAMNHRMMAPRWPSIAQRRSSLCDSEPEPICAGYDPPIGGVP